MDGAERRAAKPDGRPSSAPMWAPHTEASFDRGRCCPAGRRLCGHSLDTDEGDNLPARLEEAELLQAYTVEQVAKMLHVGRDKVYYLLRTGQLRSLKIGKLRRITEQQLADFVASLDDTRIS